MYAIRSYYESAGTPGNLFLTAELNDERLELSHGRLQLPPLVVILTRSGALDPDHPSLRSWATPVVFTSYNFV